MWFRVGQHVTDARLAWAGCMHLPKDLIANE